LSSNNNELENKNEFNDNILQTVNNLKKETISLKNDLAECKEENNILKINYNNKKNE